MNLANQGGQTNQERAAGGCPAMHSPLIYPAAQGRWANGDDCRGVIQSQPLDRGAASFTPTLQRGHAHSDKEPFVGPDGNPGRSHDSHASLLEPIRAADPDLRSTPSRLILNSVEHFAEEGPGKSLGGL